MQTLCMLEIAKLGIFVWGIYDLAFLHQPKNLSTLPMTRLDIADFLGLTIETVSRAFSTLKKTGTISFTDSHSCVIMNIQRIRDLGGREDFTQHRGSV